MKYTNTIYNYASLKELFLAHNAQNSPAWSDSRPNRAVFCRSFPFWAAEGTECAGQRKRRDKISRSSCKPHLHLLSLYSVTLITEMQIVPWKGRSCRKNKNLLPQASLALLSPLRFLPPAVRSLQKKPGKSCMLLSHVLKNPTRCLLSPPSPCSHL